MVPTKDTVSGNVGPSVYIARNRLTNAFARDLLRYWEVDGPKLIERVSQEQPGTLLKCLTMMVPREYKIEHQNPANGLSDEQLAVMVVELEEKIAARLAGEGAKVISADPVPIAAAAPKAKRLRGKDRKPRKLRGSPRTPSSP